MNYARWPKVMPMERPQEAGRFTLHEINHINTKLKPLRCLRATGHNITDVLKQNSNYMAILFAGDSVV